MMKLGDFLCYEMSLKLQDFLCHEISLRISLFLCEMFNPSKKQPNE